MSKSELWLELELERELLICSELEGFALTLPHEIHLEFNGRLSPRAGRNTPWDLTYTSANTFEYSSPE